MCLLMKMDVSAVTATNGGWSVLSVACLRRLPISHRHACQWNFLRRQSSIKRHVLVIDVLIIRWRTSHAGGHETSVEDSKKLVTETARRNLELEAQHVVAKVVAAGRCDCATDACQHVDV